MTETKRNGESEKTSAYLWFDQDQIEKKDNKIMLDIFVCETLATRALCQANALSQGTVIGLTVCRVQAAYGVPALDTYGHCFERFLSWSKMVERLGVGFSSDSMGRSVRFGASKALRLMAFQGRCLFLEAVYVLYRPHRPHRQWLWQLLNRRRSVLCQVPFSTPRRLVDLAVQVRCRNNHRSVQTRPRL